MINIFDLSAGMAGRKMLSEKDHGDGFPVQRNNPEVKKTATPSGTRIDGKRMVNDLKQNSSSKTSSGTPVKILITQELSKEKESKKTTNVVARLMGLEYDLTAQPYTEGSQRKLPENVSQTSSTGRHRGNGQQDLHLHDAVPCEFHQPNNQKMQHSDGYDFWQQTSRDRKGKYEGNHNGLRMAHVRQKFMEAKRLATGENLLHSKEFQDALEVLSSNRDLVLKFLEEPNSVLTKQLNNIHPVPKSFHARRITVLKPSGNIETKTEKIVKKQAYPDNYDCGWRTNTDHLYSQPTKIVVLKPNKEKTKGPASTIIPEHLVQRDLYVEPMDNAFPLGYVRSERAQFMEKSLYGHRRDESLLSSTFSNGYGGDRSSFNQSEIGYNEEEGGQFSDAEIEMTTPTSRYCCDRFGNASSHSSFSRVSYSPESLVVKEARRRLSERWALVASHGISKEQSHLPRSSSTLGEMLSIPEVKRDDCRNSFTVSNSRSCGGEDELSSSAFSSSVGRTMNSGELSPRNLLRSKSVPVSSSTFGDINIKSEGSGSQISICSASEVSKAKLGMLSFKGKVSKFFLSRNKKINRERTSALVGSKDADIVVAKTDEMQKSVDNSLAVSLLESPSKSVTNKPKQAMLSVEQPRTCDKSSEPEKVVQNQKFIINLDQPSPTSILDAPFEDDVDENLCRLYEANAGQKVSRAAPIESVARSLSWDDALEPSNLYKTLLKAEDNEQDYFVFVRTLLSYAGLEKSDIFFTGWHSLDSPLDPVLLDKFLDVKEDEPKCTEKWSNRRLLFDCVNSALLELGGTTLIGVRSWNRAHFGAKIKSPARSTLAEDVWGLVMGWSSGIAKLVCAETDKGIVVDAALRKEVGGNSWTELISTIQVEEITKEISAELSKDLVVEVLADLEAACCADAPFSHNLY